MAAFREETFGPILPITTFADDDEAVRLANDSHLGLQAAGSPSLSRAYRYIDDLRAGTVPVNESTNFWEQHPPSAAPAAPGPAGAASAASTPPRHDRPPDGRHRRAERRPAIGRTLDIKWT